MEFVKRAETARNISLIIFRYKILRLERINTVLNVVFVFYYHFVHNLFISIPIHEV